MDTVDALNRIGDQLTRIANVLERGEQPPSEPEGCQHPEAQRLALGTDGWQCGVCEHREFAVKVD